MQYLEMFFFLVFCHYLADYPLQGEFLATAKNPNTELGKIYWKQALFEHSFIHGCFVALVTGSIWLGLLEIGAHALTDYDKCNGKISFALDQFIHITYKFLWVVFLLLWEAK